MNICEPRFASDVMQTAPLITIEVAIGPTLLFKWYKTALSALISFSQSINQSINQSTDQSINQSVDPTEKNTPVIIKLFIISLISRLLISLLCFFVSVLDPVAYMELNCAT